LQLRNRCEQMSQMLDWKNLGKAYQEARNLALERVYGPPASEQQPDIASLNMYVFTRSPPKKSATAVFCSLHSSRYARVAAVRKSATAGAGPP
jgi:hypothetical protein